MSLSESLYQANRLDLLSRMAGDISHEIKNPLHAMVINLELVRRKVEKGEGELAVERVAIVEEEVRKVHALANALLEALRPPRDAHTTCGFSAVLQELAPLVSARARLARVDLTIEDGAGPLTVPLAAHELRLVLLNLADRVIRAAGQAGQATLAVRPNGNGLGVEIVADAPLLDDAELDWLHNGAAQATDVDLGLRVVHDLATRAGGSIVPGADADGRHRLSVSLQSDASA